MKTGKLCRRPGVKWHASGSIDTANSCRHHDDCPVLYGMREYSKEQDGGEPEQQPVVKRRQRVKREAGAVDGGDSEIGGEPDDPSGQPP